MTSNELQRVFVKSDNTAKVRCPSCGIFQTISISPEELRKLTRQVTCSCSAVFKIHILPRKFYRKDTNIEGTYFVLDDNDHGQDLSHAIRRVNCRIENLSMTGAGFSTFGRHRIKEEDRLFICFFLDNPEKTRIGKSGVAKFIKGNCIGMAFDEPASDIKALGFYLMP